MTLIERLTEVQNGNQEILLELINEFKPLLNKYARKISDADAFENLQLKLIESIKKMTASIIRTTEDKFILSYIEKIIYRHYIFLSKQKNILIKEIPFSSLMREDEYPEPGIFILDILIAMSDEDIYIQYDFLRRTLTKYEFEIIIHHYFNLYTINEIAQFYSVSSSAISKAKSNALKKLRKVYIAK